MSNKIFAAIVGLVAATLLLATCGESSSSEEYTCCYSDQYYDCPSQDELNKCAKGESSDCDRQPSNDDECDDSGGGSGGY